MNLMAEQETRTPLSDLVVTRRAELRLSYAKLAKACVDPDTGVQEWQIGRLHRLAHRENIHSPTAEEIRALAAGLELPVRIVADASGEQFLGVTTTDVDTEGRVRLLAHRASSMSEADLERLLAIAETFPVRHPHADGST